MHTRRRVAAFLGPAPADFAFLADPAFILHPDFDLRRLGMLALDLGQNLRERLLERRLSDRVCLMVPRSADQRHKVHRMEPCARGFRTDANTPCVLHLDFGAFKGSRNAFVGGRLAYFCLKRTKSIAPVATAAR